MPLKEIEIVSEQTVFSDRLRILKAEIRAKDSHNNPIGFSRLKVDREDASAVVLFNEQKDLFYFIRQFRYAIAQKESEFLLELVAGKVDDGEDPLTTAVRETEEEAGFVVAPEQLRHICSFYASPGYTSEKYHLYLANVSQKDKIHKGGGLAQENEYIGLVEMDRTLFFDACRSGTIHDAKTLMAGLWLEKELG